LNPKIKMKAAGASNSDNMNVTHQPISSFYGTNVFGKRAMEKYLTKTAIAAVEHAIQTGESLPRDTADEVAEGMKNWAISKGATHYTHWFQPLRGTTAEKHDAFFEPTGMETGVEASSGKALVQQEPYASSLPSGGRRNTFEARGYSALDPSSPAFIIEKSSGITLCIPTVFVSYTG